MEKTFEIELDGITYVFDAGKYDEIRDYLDMNADEVRE